ncbi:uncharacterized protein LOC128960966 isoform X2 [Oppia nitens]|uniref:uncharacterized protein LOC128960966 isoform X2 n=1 Tax=Oppia nitens TaxID=1686743 RepID=UPI0023DA9888|nr:uncharacterized protein LOC128960966 isoform X2 [Oppia nitens]
MDEYYTDTSASDLEQQISRFSQQPTHPLENKIVQQNGQFDDPIEYPVSPIDFDGDISMNTLLNGLAENEQQLVEEVYNDSELKDNKRAIYTQVYDNSLSFDQQINVNHNHNNDTNSEQNITIESLVPATNVITSVPSIPVLENGEKVKRKRGRPKKYPNGSPNKSKRPRGRPPLKPEERDICKKRRETKASAKYRQKLKQKSAEEIKIEKQLIETNKDYKNTIRDIKRQLQPFIRYYHKHQHLIDCNRFEYIKNEIMN